MRAARLFLPKILGKYFPRTHTHSLSVRGGQFVNLAYGRPEWAPLGRLANFTVRSELGPPAGRGVKRPLTALLISIQS
jgi:hypothetical protein